MASRAVPQSSEEFINQASGHTAHAMLSLKGHTPAAEPQDLFRQAFFHTLENHQELLQFFNLTTQEMAKNQTPRAKTDTVLEANFSKKLTPKSVAALQKSSEAFWAKFDKSIQPKDNPFAINSKDIADAMRNPEKLATALKNQLTHQYKLKNSPGLHAKLKKTMQYIPQYIPKIKPTMGRS